MSGRWGLTITAALLLLAACGGDGEENVDADALLDRAFANPIASSRTEAQLDADLDGIPLLEDRPVRVRVDGPYVSGEGVRIPSFNWDVDAGAGGLGLGADVISTGDNAFVRFAGDTFEVGSARASAQNAELAGLRVEPREWLSDPKLEGEEDVGGVETHRLSAVLDGPRLVEDLRTLSRGFGAGEPTSRKLDFVQRREVAEAIESSSVDVWIGKEDELVHRLAVELDFAVTPERRQALGGAVGGELKLDVLLSEIGEAQRIAAPPGPYRPIEALRDRLPSIRGFSP